MTSAGAGLTAPPDVSVAILAYNEFGSLARVLDDLEHALAAYRAELIIVDDGSTDGTGALADAFAAGRRNVRVVHHAANRGGGAAIRTGLATARGDLVAVVPGDGQFVARDLPQFIAASRRADVVVSRRTNRTAGVRRRVSSWAYRTIIRWTLGVNVSDVNWVKMYRRADVERLPLTADSWLVDAEILYRLTRSGRSIVEIPVTELPRRSGTATGGNPAYMLATVRELVRFIRQLRASAPPQPSVAESRSRT